MLRDPLRSRGSPNKGRQNRNWLPHPCLLEGPKKGRNDSSPPQSRVYPDKGAQNQKRPPHPCLLKRSKEGGNAISPLHSRGLPKESGTKSEWATSPLPSRGPKRGQKCYLAPAFSGDAQTKADIIKIGSLTNVIWRAQNGAEMLPHPRPKTEGDKIRMGCLTAAFSGAQTRAEMLPHPCVLRGSPKKKGQNRIG